METRRGVAGLIDFIAGRYASAAEIGIGHFPDVARGLQVRGVRVFATDIRQYLHAGVKVFLDDVTGPDLSLYHARDLIYSMRPPAELLPYIVTLAGSLSVDAIVKPLSSEYPEGWELMKHGNSTFFIITNHMRTLNV